MADEPPARVDDFYKKIQTLSFGELQKHPNFIDLDSNERLVQHPLLSLDASKTRRLQEDYARVQGLMFDFAGRCSQGCQEKAKHLHSVQAGPVLTLKDFPGVSIYCGLLKPILSKLKEYLLVPHISELNSQGPIDTGHLLELHGDRLSSEVTQFLSDILPGTNKPDSAAVQIWHPNPPSPIRSESGKAIHLNPGPDTTFILGCEQDQSNREPVVTPALCNDEESWKDLIADDSASDAEDESPILAPASQPEHAQVLEQGLVALHLRAGDVLVFTNPKLKAWYGVTWRFEDKSLASHVEFR